MLYLELDDFDLFMTRHSLEFRKAVDGYLDDKTVEDENPTSDMIIDRARTMQSFIDYMLEQRGLIKASPSPTQQDKSKEG